MPQKTTPGSSSDPTAVWRQWYDNAASVWTNMLDGAKEAYIDPFGIYRQWLKSAEQRQEERQEERQGKGGSAPTSASAPSHMDPGDLWKEWFDAATAMWRKVAGASPADPLGLTAKWTEMLEESRAQMLSKEGPPLDPLSFLREWYDKTSQTWSTVVGDLIGTDAFIESASRFFASYASYYKSLRQASETQLHQLQIPTRSDVARVAGLVVALEDKVDQLADAVDAANDRHAQLATEAAVSALEERLEQRFEERIARVESRLDALLKAVEGLGTASRRSAAATRRPATTKRAAAEESTNASQAPGRPLATRARRAAPPSRASRRAE